MNNKKMDIFKLTIEETVRLLKNGGYPEANAQIVQNDIDAGCPLNEDGTINLFNYAAWLYVGGSEGRINNE
jgi:hypothetical protein